jgi:hypothetical protein
VRGDPGRSTRTEPSTTSRRSQPAVADPHHGLAVAVVALLAERDDRVEQLAGSCEKTRGSSMSRS